MKIAIHNSPNSFSQEWISYLEKENINFELVDCYDSNIISHLKKFDGLMWHFHHMGVKDLVMAKPLLHALHHAQYPIFPSYETMWHFDNKVAQKYLLEALGLPLVKSYVQFDKKSALDWVKQTSLPKVFKLKGGAGSANVKLVNTHNKAKKLINKSFSQGFSNYRSLENLEERYRLYKQKKINFWTLLKGVLRLFKKPMYDRVMGKEIAYTYWQDFVPHNDFDIRVVVIGTKAFAIKRLNRKGDFRASGSGHILYEKKHFSDSLIDISFEAADKLEAQCIAFDFVSLDNKPQIVEISYGFSKAGYTDCTGYWDKDLVWHEGKFDPYGWMVNDFIKQIEMKINS